MKKVKGIVITLIIVVMLFAGFISVKSKQEQYNYIKHIHENNFMNIEKATEIITGDIRENYDQILLFIGLQTAMIVYYLIIINAKYKKTRGKIKKENFNMNFNNLSSPEKISIIYNLKVKKYNVLLSMFLSLKERNLIEFKEDRLVINNIEMCTKTEKKFIEILINKKTENTTEVKFDRIKNNIRNNYKILEEINSMNNDILEELYEEDIFERDLLKEKRFTKIVALVNTLMIVIMLLFYRLTARWMITMNLVTLGVLYVLYKKFLHKVITFNNATNCPKNKVINFLAIVLVLVYLLCIKIILSNVESLILIINVLCNLVLLLIGKRNQLTLKGINEYNKILGLKNYLEVNNECIKDHVSYAVALGLEDKYNNSINNEIKDIIKEFF